MGAIVSIITGLLGKIIGPLLGILEKWGIWRAGKSAGRAEQRAADLQANQDRTRDANQARAGVAGASDDELDDSLRDPSARRRH